MLITLTNVETNDEVFINSNHIIALEPIKDKFLNRIYSKIILSNNGSITVVEEPKYIQDIINMNL